MLVSFLFHFQGFEKLGAKTELADIGEQVLPDGSILMKLKFHLYCLVIMLPSKF